MKITAYKNESVRKPKEESLTIKEVPVLLNVSESSSNNSFRKL